VALSRAGDDNTAACILATVHRHGYRIWRHAEAALDRDVVTAPNNAAASPGSLLEAAEAAVAALDTVFATGGANP
jgi:hypothetical protein